MFFWPLQQLPTSLPRKLTMLQSQRFVFSRSFHAYALRPIASHYLLFKVAPSRCYHSGGKHGSSRKSLSEPRRSCKSNTYSSLPSFLASPVRPAKMLKQLHSSALRPKPTSDIVDGPVFHPPSPDMMPVPAPLSVLPLTTVVRSLVVTSISSSRLLLPPSLWIMSVLAHTKNPLLNPDYNPLLRMFIKKTFYAQFCAGETHQEVSKTISSLKNMGFTGVVLGYAKEVVLDDKEAKCLVEAKADGDADYARTQVAPWAEGTMETVFLAQPGDFVALKLVRYPWPLSLCARLEPRDIAAGGPTY